MDLFNLANEKQSKYKNSELNLKLLYNFPELESWYSTELLPYEGHNTDSKIIYKNVFSKFFILCLDNDDMPRVKRIFDYLESLLALDNYDIERLVADSVIHRVARHFRGRKEIIRMVGPRTKNIIFEIDDLMSGLYLQAKNNGNLDDFFRGNMSNMNKRRKP
ncbi:hypothetical protein LJB88_02260 [Erysipelotrichaceae bacterium OttesenSCG-928-M19]|nr:hypothetical protein [Erysipelotrichaceae bacterium OttesenSCG-928-M19]